MKNYSASIDSIESFSTKDGPGVRTVIFFNGCKLRCLFCHNPETWTRKEDNTKVKELYEKIIKFKPYFGDKGGVTFSGGEPLLHSEFIIELSKLLKKDNINIALDTAGVGNSNYLELLEYIDLVILDIKDYREDGYKKMTGLDMEKFKEFLNLIQKLNKKIWIRQVIVPGINDNKEYILGLKQYIKNIKNIENIELLPYHTMAIDKYKKLNIDYILKDTKDMDINKCLELEKILKED
ncbi:MAG: pyruvate formate lyase-activating protein [Lactobacillales bacterium]|nr:pyruvate formate lyase-activating protein [Lactobacillales bacterium]